MINVCFVYWKFILHMLNSQGFATKGKGWAIRTLEYLPKGSFVCEYIGEILTNTELYERNEQRKKKNERHTYPVLLDNDWGSEQVLKDEEALCLDATHYGNVARFINHRYVKYICISSVLKRTYNWCILLLTSQKLNQLWL